MQLCAARAGLLPAKVRRAWDWLRSASRQGPLLLLVKLDLATGPLTLHQARTLVHLDIYRCILNNSRNTNALLLWGFPRSSTKSAAGESDLLTTVRRLGLQSADLVLRNDELRWTERRLPEDSSLVVDLSAEEDASPPVRDVLKSQPAHLLRLSALLQSDDWGSAGGAMRFYSAFFSAADEYVSDRLSAAAAAQGDADTQLLKMVAEQEVKCVAHLEGLETRKALDVLWETMVLFRTMLESGVRGPPPLSVTVASGRLRRRLSSLGIRLDTEDSDHAELDGRVSCILDAMAQFRQDVRQFALKDRQRCGELMSACDALRDALSDAGVTLQDRKGQTPWMWKTTSAAVR